MDARFLALYNRELQHLREGAVEFAREFPKIAGRLAIENAGECPDPYVERLLEGFAFLAARVQLKLDSEFPRFTQHLLEMVYPHYLAPTPSLAVVQVQPDLGQAALAEGFRLPRGTALRSGSVAGSTTPCRFSTGQDLDLWPLELAAVEYQPHVGLDFTSLVPAGRAVLRLTLRSTVPCAQLALDALPIYLLGGDEIRMRLYERLLSSAAGVIVRSAGAKPVVRELLGAAAVQRCGFDPDSALLPHGPRSYDGYRLLQEYFAFPDRFFFVRLAGLNPAVRRCPGSEFGIDVVLSRADPELTGAIDTTRVALHCTTAINLFARSADRIHVDQGQHEFHLVTDRTRPLDYEVHTIDSVEGIGTRADDVQPFLPLYAASDAPRGVSAAYYTMRREPRLVPESSRTTGSRSAYFGSEVFLALVDPQEAPYRPDIKQLAVQVLCTNRGLPLRLVPGQGRTDFTLETGAPVEAVRCVAGPTPPRRSPPPGDTVWRLISHLSLNYLSLADADEQQGATALRDLLRLYADEMTPAIRKQVEGVRSVISRPVVRRIPTDGPVTFGRGLEVTLAMDETAFAGSGVFLLGAVLEQFFRRYVSINSFTETILTTPERGEVMRWPAQLGRRPTF